MYVSFYCMFPLFLIVSCIFFIILYYVYDFIINRLQASLTGTSGEPVSLPTYGNDNKKNCIVCTVTESLER